MASIEENISKDDLDDGEESISAAGDAGTDIDAHLTISDDKSEIRPDEASIVDDGEASKESTEKESKGEFTEEEQELKQQEDESIEDRGDQKNKEQKVVDEGEGSEALISDVNLSETADSEVSERLEGERSLDAEGKIALAVEEDDDLALLEEGGAPAVEHESTPVVDENVLAVDKEDVPALPEIDCPKSMTEDLHSANEEGEDHAAHWDQENVEDEISKQEDSQDEGKEILDEESKDSWIEDAEDGDDGFQEADPGEPMETDEFDELERAVKEQSKQMSEAIETGEEDVSEEKSSDDDERMEEDDTSKEDVKITSGSEEQGGEINLKSVPADESKDEAVAVDSAVDDVDASQNETALEGGSLKDDGEATVIECEKKDVDSKTELEKGAVDMESKEGAVEMVTDSEKKGADGELVAEKEENLKDDTLTDVTEYEKKEEGNETETRLVEGAVDRESVEGDVEMVTDSEEKNDEAKSVTEREKGEHERQVTESGLDVDRVEEQKRLKPTDESGNNAGVDEEAEDGKDPLSESQEMMMQYDGEDLLETMGDGESKENSEKQVEGGEKEEMEVEKETTEERESVMVGKDNEGNGDNDETDVIDMIEERTVSPGLLRVADVSMVTMGKGKKGTSNDASKEISDIIILDDDSKTDAKSEEGGDKSKETSPFTSEEKKRKPGGLSSIVSRLTQNLSEKKTEDSKSLDKSPPVISQVKSLSQEPSKEKSNRKQVYKKEDVLNRCSVCFNPFLSLNPIKFNNKAFCSDECLHKKKGAGSESLTCTYCKTAFQKDAVESFTLKIGLQQKPFCSQNCKSDYQKRVKPCSNCGEDITGTNNAFMAQVGAEGKFLEFCSQACVEIYEKKLKEQPPPSKKEISQSGEKKTCSMCHKNNTIKHEVKFRGSYYHMCGSDCFASFRKKYNLSLRTCNQCGTTCYNEKCTPGDDKDGHKVFFCSQKCLEVFQHSRSLSEPCFNCKTMFKQGMLIEGKGVSGKTYKFCSQDCMRKFLPVTTSKSAVSVLSNAATVPRLNTTNVVPTQGPRMTTQVQTTSVKPVPQPKVVQSSTESSASGQNQGIIPCNHCKKSQRPQYHLTMSDGSLRNFCSYPCVIAFQAQFNVPPVTLPQETLLLKCGQCKRGFSHRPETLDYHGETRLFCCNTCLEDFKKTQSVIAICDCCFEEKILFEETNFLGKARYFCSPGCSLIFKNQFVKRIGLRCAMCDYCSTMCKIATVSVMGGSKKRFCGEDCKESYNQWYNRMARCEGCKRMGCELTESFRWRGKVKRVCNEQCLLLFYTQQNMPDMGTQLQSELNGPVKPTENGTSGGSFPTITNVKSLAGPQITVSTPQVKHVPMAHKQTQITTNTIFVKPPPPPPTPPPPAPKQVKNKITLCKPYAVSKMITCKPITSNQGCQTNLYPVFVPVPIPIFVPVPMQMYTTPVPYPLPIPIPVPTPMFIPVAYSDCDKLMESIEEIKNTIPTDPLEADILMMATAIAGKEESARKPPPPEPTLSDEDGVDDDDITDLLPLEDVEVPDLPNKFLDAESDIAGILAEGLETLDPSDLFPEEKVARSASQSQEDSEPSISRRSSRIRGAKRVCLDTEDEDESTPSPGSGKEDVRPDIGPAAYSFFLQQMSKDGGPQDEKLKSNLSLASVDELHYCLCRFVKEARQPDGEVYPPDTLFLILLSIQKYLTTNQRKENIFMDPYFQTFSNLLHVQLGEHSIIMDPMSEIDVGATCLDEEFLWESKQLGSHSPSVLLNTILYYCTKELMLKTVAMHQELAFSRVQRLVRKDSRGKREAYIRFLPSEEQRLKGAETEGKGKKRPLEIDYSLELHVNVKHPLRCPVKLHQFYLSKCPESVRTSKNAFYLVPERACVPDSPLWYSDKPMPDSMIERFLWRHLMVKDIHENWEMMKVKRDNNDSDSEND